MNRLRTLIARLGIPEVARRVGVLETTVRRWARKGLSSSAKEAVYEIFARHEHSRLAAETRKKRVRAEKARKTRATRDAFRAEVAEAAQVPLADAPREPPRTRKVRDYQAPGGAPLAIDTFRYEGESHTFTIGQPLEDVDDGAIAQLAVSTWKNAIPFRAFCRVIFLFFRYVARTSRDEWYRGQLVPKAGRWFDWWASTKPFTTSSSIDASVLQTMDAARNKTIGNRVVWLEQVQVNLFEWKEDIDIKKLTEAPLS
jgi:hypothetical protein